MTWLWVVLGVYLLASAVLVLVMSKAAGLRLGVVGSLLLTLVWPFILTILFLLFLLGVLSRRGRREEELEENEEEEEKTHEDAGSGVCPQGLGTPQGQAPA